MLTRKTANQIKAASGDRFDQKTFDSFTEADIECMAKEDSEDDFFPPDQKPTRISRLFELFK